MASYVWEIFVKLPEEKDRVKCTLCENKLSYKQSSTSSLKRHAERYHEDVVKKIARKNKSNNNNDNNNNDDSSSSQKSSLTSTTTVANQPCINTFFKSKQMLDSSSTRAKCLTEHIINMITLDLQPLSIVVEDVGFRGLMGAAESRYVIPSRVTFRKKLIPAAYKDAAEKLKIRLQEQCADVSTVCITTDAWTSITLTSYVTYTLHLINQDFQMENYVLGTYQFRDEHTAANLRSHIFKIVSRWCTFDSLPSLPLCYHEVQDDDESEPEGLEIDEEDPIIATIDPTDFQLPENISVYITTDNASNVCKAVRESSFVHVRCFTHTINLAVQKGLAVVDTHLVKLRKVVGHFHKSTKSKNLLQVI